MIDARVTEEIAIPSRLLVADRQGEAVDVGTTVRFVALMTNERHRVVAIAAAHGHLVCTADRAAVQRIRRERIVATVAVQVHALHDAVPRRQPRGTKRIALASRTTHRRERDHDGPETLRPARHASGPGEDHRVSSGGIGDETIRAVPQPVTPSGRGRRPRAGSTERPSRAARSRWPVRGTIPASHRAALASSGRLRIISVRGLSTRVSVCLRW